MNKRYGVRGEIKNFIGFLNSFPLLDILISFKLLINYTKIKFSKNQTSVPNEDREFNDITDILFFLTYKMTNMVDKDNNLYSFIRTISE